MPLNLAVGGDGEFTPFLKYNAKSGRWYVKPEGGGDDIEVQNPRLAFDMENIKTGWLYYEQGSGPEKVWDSSRTQMAAKPTGPRKFKRGFEVMVYGGDDIPGIGKLGLREFSSTASNCITAILEMFNAYEAAMKTNAGKIPFFGCSGVRAIAGMYGTNYEPMFKLLNWVERSRIPAFDEHRSPVTNGKTPIGDGGSWQEPPQADPFERGAGSLDDIIPFECQWK